jgi:hypothetical protein
MGLRAGERYVGKVVEGSRLFQSNAKKTTGFQVNIEVENGGPFPEKTDFTIWLTPKNRERALQSFEALGVSEEDLASASFVKYQLPQVIVGTEVEFEMKEETYRDQKQLKVAWIGKRGAVDEGELVNAVVGMFGGTAQQSDSKDDDIDF